MNSTLKKVRAQSIPKCQSPAELDNILNYVPEIRDKFSMLQNEDFYQGIIRDGDTFANLFIAQKILRKCGPKQKLSVDGTFSVVPKGFSQLLMIFADIDEKPTPVGFALMTSRKVNIVKLQL